LTKRAPFKEADVTRLIRATARAGWTDPVVEVIYAGGGITKLTVRRRTEAEPATNPENANEWALQ